MCVLVVAFQAHSDFKLVLGLNRDEFYDRPSSAAAFWDIAPQLLAGKDLKQGGTWLGITKHGRIAVITNYRDPTHHNQGAPSRGILLRDYLLSDMGPSDYSQILRDTGAYNGFNLIFGDQDHLYYYSNKTSRSRHLSPGVYGLSNHLLDTPWPKVKKCKRAFENLLSSEMKPTPEQFLEILSDRTRPRDDELPHTGVGLEWERILSPIFIASDTYGTRSSTAMIIDHKGDVTFVERSFGAGSADPETARFHFTIAKNL